MRSLEPRQNHCWRRLEREHAKPRGHDFPYLARAEDAVIPPAMPPKDIRRWSCSWGRLPILGLWPEQFFDPLEEFLSLFGMNHMNVAGETAQVRGKTRMAARLGGDSVKPAVVENGPEAASFLARHAQGVVDDDARDDL